MSELLAWINIDYADEVGLLEVAIVVADTTEASVLGSVGYAIEPENMSDLENLSEEKYSSIEHSKLLYQIEHSLGCLSPRKAEKEILELLLRFAGPGEMILAGRNLNEIRVVLQECMPALEEFFYQDLDFDLNMITLLIIWSDLFESLEPQSPTLIADRSINHCMQNLMEFESYKQILKAVPLIDSSDELDSESDNELSKLEDLLDITKDTTEETTGGATDA